MTSRGMVIALGGNALLRPTKSMTMGEQFRASREAMQAIAPLAEKNRLVITHGNGPQVGNILIRTEAALGKAYAIPLEVAVAESEGELGYVLDQSLYNEFLRRKIRKPIAALLTQVRVDAKDPAFKHPTKPVGPFLEKRQATQLKKKRIPVTHVPGKGWRRVVPSPRPLEILEGKIISRLLGQNVVVIAAGGGGIPVVKKKNRIEGVEAVIDKDHASACLARSVKAGTVLSITGVSQVMKHYLTDKEEPINRMNIKQARTYLREGHFPAGSMGPKIEAAIAFLNGGGKKVIITDIPHVGKALDGKAGTWIVK